MKIMECSKHSEINSMLSPEVKDQLKNLNDNKEFVELVEKDHWSGHQILFLIHMIMMIMQ